MRFGDPLLLAALAVVPLTLLFYFFVDRRRGAIVFSDVSIFKNIPKSKAVRLRHVTIILRVLAVAAIAVALARPHSTTKSEQMHTEGIDIVLALDSSTSMQSDDFKPKNRFQAAKDVISDFVSQNRDNRLGLVMYAGQAYTQCPLTLDYGVLLSILDRMEIGMIEDGTAIGLAIAAGVNRLKDSDSKSKVIILLTDGMNNRGEIDPITAAKIAKTFNVRIHTILMGRENTPMKAVDAFGRKVVVRNPDGSIRYVEMDPDTLMEISRITGGLFFRAEDETKLARIYKDIATMEKSKIKTEQKINYTEYFQYLLLPAILLLMLEAGLSATRFRITP